MLLFICSFYPSMVNFICGSAVLQGQRLDTHLIPEENRVLGDSQGVETEIHCQTLSPDRTLDRGCVSLIETAFSTVTTGAQ